MSMSGTLVKLFLFCLFVCFQIKRESGRGLSGTEIANSILCQSASQNAVYELDTC